MRASDLYEKLEKDFDLDSCKDVDIKCWSGMEFNKYVPELFRKRYMGLYIDNSTEIKTVYTAVFPSDKVIKHILATGVTDTLLFVHHPMIWDIRLPDAFTYIDSMMHLRGDLLWRAEREFRCHCHWPKDQQRFAVPRSSFHKLVEHHSAFWLEAL